MQWEENRTNFDRNLAVVIGIDRYNSNGIHDLKTAVGDAIAIADLLEKEYAYKKTDIIQLLDGEATLTGLKDLLSDTIPNQLKPTSSDRLIFYYAGHGIPRNSKDGPAGYLVPQNADLNNADSFLPMQYVYEQLSQLTCHHLLVILDCCFAGIFQWAGSRKLISILETVRREHYDRFIRFPAWQVITSSAHDQEAMDVALDNTVLAEDNRGTVTNSLHSPFALALIEALQDGEPDEKGRRYKKADLTKDGVITAHELYLYLEQRVSELSKERQNPGLYPLRREYDRGEFIFTKPGFARDQLKPAPPLDENNNPYRGLKSFDEKHAGFFFGRQALIEELAKRLLVPNQPLAVVLGVSGSGKSSLVKAGLIPYLRDKQANQWYTLEPMRPGELPFTSLARVLLPVVNANLLEQLSQVSFLDEALKRVLESKTEADQDLVRADQAKPESDRSFQMNETLIKVAQSWCSGTPEAKLLLVEDYFAQLEILCRPEEQQLLVRLHDEILARLDSLLGHLQQDPQYLIAAIETWSQNHPDIKLLLVIDQFEELITASHEAQADSREDDETGGDRTTEAKQWQQFLEMLRGAIAACPGQWRVVLTLRSDFEPRFLDSPLKLYWKDGRFPVRAMNSDELRQAIEGPALKQALYFEPPELVGKLIDEVGQMPGALPLLSFTLSELYIKLRDRWINDNASDRALRIKDYEELGGVAGTLTRRATEEYDNLVRDFGEVLGKAYQATMRRVMLRMVAIEGGGMARRRVPESELVYPDSEENKRVVQVSDQLVKARLLVKAQETGEPYVEPAHDFLVRGWDKLQSWLKEEQENIALQQRLTPQAHDWYKAVIAAENREKDEQVTGLLWNNDPRLEQLRDVLNSETNNWLNQRETEFVKSSIQRKQWELEETKRQLQISEQLRIEAENARKAETEQRKNAEIGGLGAASESLFASYQELEALIASMRAGRQLQQLQQEGGAQAETKMRVVTALQNIIYTIRERNRLEAHRNWVNCLSFSPKEPIFASGSSDRTIKLWNADGSLRQTFKDERTTDGESHNDSVTSVSINSDGQMIASASSDGTIKLWNKDGTLLQTFHDANAKDGKSHDSSVTSISFYPDSKTIVSAGEDKTIKLWNINGTLDKVFKDAPSRDENSHEDSVTSVSVSLTGLVASASKDRIIKLWNKDGTLLQIFKDAKTKQGKSHDSGITCVSFSPDGTRLASCSEDKTIKLWNLDGTLVKTLVGHDATVTSVNFYPNSELKTIVSTGSDSTVRIWDLDEGKELKVFRGHGGGVFSASFSPDGKMIASVSGDNTIRLWSTNKNTSIFLLRLDNVINEGLSLALDDFYSFDFNPDELGVTPGVSFSPDNLTIVTASNDGNILFWDLNGNQRSFPNGFSSRRRKPISGGLDDLAFPLDKISVSFSPDSQIIASASYNGTVKIWNIQGKAIGTLEGHEDAVSDVMFSPKDRILASASYDGTVKIWNVDNAKLLKSIEAHDGFVSSISFSPDGQMLASVGDDGAIKIWNILNIENPEIYLAASDENTVKCVRFSPDGKLIAAAFDDGKIKIFSFDRRKFKTKLLREFKAHTDEVKSISFSHDFSDKNQIIASVSRYEVKLWSLDGVQLTTLKPPQEDAILSANGKVIPPRKPSDAFEEIRFSSNGKMLIVSDSSGTVYLWNFNLNALLVLGCNWLYDYLNNNPNIRKEDFYICKYLNDHS